MEKEKYSSLMAMILSFILFLSLIFTSCTEEKISASESKDDEDSLNNTPDVIKKAPEKHDDYDLDNAYINHDTLFINVRYSGGCKEHAFSLKPEKLQNSGNGWIFKLYHNANDDRCEAYLLKTIKWNISALFDSLDIGKTQPLFISNPGNQKRVQVENKNEEDSIPYNKGCTVTAMAEQTPCGPGIWGRTWLKWNGIWLQPVKSSEAIGSVKAGKQYRVEIKKAYPPFSDLKPEVVCQALPEGTIKPVEILCIKSVM